ncbi:8400_t:CDS:2 [Gigaspora margarita]|uniref:8400_t:CDS:1 n=1 Tax=Gigaspora margarita TaxID=4874 RepID=A0ABN7UH35_GIGMA|nr:8400_t:CDS:2 [Gigaspora margarita]
MLLNKMFLKHGSSKISSRLLIAAHVFLLSHDVYHELANENHVDTTPCQMELGTVYMKNQTSQTPAKRNDILTCASNLSSIERTLASIEGALALIEGASASIKGTSISIEEALVFAALVVIMLGPSFLVLFFILKRPWIKLPNDLELHFAEELVDLKNEKQTNNLGLRELLLQDDSFLKNLKDSLHLSSSQIDKENLLESLKKNASESAKTPSQKLNL